MTEPFGNALKELREQAGLSLLQLADATHIARGHLYRLEAGTTTEPTEATLNTLAKALGVEPEELYEIAWQTTGTGPGLPSLSTYFRSKYQLDDDQIAAVERTMKRVTKDTSTNGPKSRPRRE